MAYRLGDGAVIDRAREDRWTASITAPSIVPVLSRGRAEPRREYYRAPRLTRGIEIDCIRHLVPPAIVAIAEQRAAEADIGTDRVLIAWGVVSEETYVAALATALDIPFEPLSHTSRRQCPLPDHQLVEAANTGMLPLMSGHELRIVVAPRLVDSRRLLALAMSGSEPARRLRLTSTARLRGFVDRYAAGEIEHRAVNELHLGHPELSAVGGREPIAVLGAGVAAIALAGMVAPGATLTAVELMFGLIFLGWTGLRLVGLLSEPLVRGRPRILTDDRLPTYTIAIALYEEAAAVPGLVAALRGLNYPLEKLDIKLVLEPDDHETRRAIERLQLGFPFEIVVAPDRGPRTKPKALNAALPYARGAFVAVFDAEDRPEPDQLRLALDAFVAGNERLACVQARLTVHRRIRRLVRCIPAWLGQVATAAAARRLVEPFPGVGIAEDWSLGPLQCYRGCRPRHAACSLRLSHRSHSVDDV